MTLMCQCDRCKKTFALGHKDRSDSEHVNGIAFQDIDYNKRYYTRSSLMLCPGCLEELKTFLNIKEDK